MVRPVLVYSLIVLATIDSMIYIWVIYSFLLLLVELIPKPARILFFIESLMLELVGTIVKVYSFWLYDIIALPNLMYMLLCWSGELNWARRPTGPSESVDLVCYVCAGRSLVSVDWVGKKHYSMKNGLQKVPIFAFYEEKKECCIVVNNTRLSRRCNLRNTYNIYNIIFLLYDIKFL